LERRIVLQFALLFRGRHIFVAAQPVAGMAARLRTPLRRPLYLRGTLGLIRGRLMVLLRRSESSVERKARDRHRHRQSSDS
jgi:hypothetical protein